VAGGWLSADYLAPDWVADGYLPKQPYVPTPGAWVNKRYLSKKYVSENWLRSFDAALGATIAVDNVPALLLAVLPGSARQTTKVNATTVTVPLDKFATVVVASNVGTRVTQANVPGLVLADFDTTVNGGISQVADITFTLEVESSFGYVKAVAADTAAVALAAIDAIVTTGANVNVAATRVDVPLVALPTSAKANSSTRAVSSIATPLQVFACAVSAGRVIDVLGLPLATPLTVIPVGVAAASSTHVVATLAQLPLETYSVGVEPEAAETEQPSGGGWGFHALELARRKRRKKRQQEIEEETEQIEDPTDRQIAKLLREQEAEDEGTQEFERLAEIVEDADLDAARQYSAAVADAFSKALETGKREAFVELERELKNAREEEEFLLTALLMLMD
jgi:hypothetical protein